MQHNLTLTTWEPENKTDSNDEKVIITSLTSLSNLLQKSKTYPDSNGEKRNQRLAFTFNNLKHLALARQQLLKICRVKFFKAAQGIFFRHLPLSWAGRRSTIVNDVTSSLLNSPCFYAFEHPHAYWHCLKNCCVSGGSGVGFVSKFWVIWTRDSENSAISSPTPKSCDILM